MTRAPYVLGKADTTFAREQQLQDTTLGWRFVNPALAARYGVDAMAQTAEHLAREHGIARADQDAFAFRSQQRAARATAVGRWETELMPVGALLADEQPRPDTTADKLAALAPILGPGTTITAGNASGLNDGACALLLASESAATRWGLVPRARVLGLAAAGVPPRTMGIGPVPAIGRLLGRLGLRLDDFSAIEVNEAFAAQVLAVTRALGLADDAAHVNANGGALALGHPLGASGARLVLTATEELRLGRAERALVALCVGVGQGVALALERVA
jgi:acetyl-CoA acetyltransferase family protein